VPGGRERGDGFTRQRAVEAGRLVVSMDNKHTHRDTKLSARLRHQDELACRASPFEGTMRIGGAHADQHLPATGLRSRCFNNLKNFWPAKMAELDGSHQRLASLDAAARYLP
jgi:hypothetical protein